MYPVPRSLTAPIAPSGQPFINVPTILFRGNTNSGGMNEPAAFMQHNAVMLAPRSALDILRTCLTPLVAITLQGLATVVKPVSSQFHMQRALKSAVFNTSLYITKKWLTAPRLNPPMRAKLVAIGMRVASIGCRFKKQLNQSSPAMPVFLLNWCFTPLFSATVNANRLRSRAVEPYICCSVL